MNRRSRQRNVILIGFSGSGKTSVGKKLASLLGLPFFDTDALIEKRTRKSVSRIFAEDGQQAFRRLEREVATAVLRRKGKGSVVALGGGAFENKNIRLEAHQAGTVVFLSCSRRELYRRLRGKGDRPLLQTSQRGRHSSSDALRQRIYMLLDRRLRNYRNADMSVSTTDRSIGRAAAIIKRKLMECYATG